ncbi:MAG: hypothetical protein PVI23_16285, partial [Maricaulaceae bacterium]
SLGRVGRGTVELGGATWEQTSMALTRPAIFEYFLEQDVSALVGARMFDDVSLVLDFPEQTVLILVPRRQRALDLQPVERGFGQFGE